MQQGFQHVKHIHMYLLVARFLSEKITSSAQFIFSSLKLHYKETVMTTYQNM